MEPSLVGNFIRFSTAKQVWDSIATTYFDGFDSSQVYDLRRRVSRMRQGGGSIQKYYNDLQGLWHEIDFCRPNPMECAMDIQKYNSLLQEERVYIFLDGLDDRLDNIRSDPQLTKIGSSTRSKGQSGEGKCTHCGNTKHTRDTCFKLHGYPDWWHELQTKKKQDTANTTGNMGHTAVATAEPQLALIPGTYATTVDSDKGKYGQAFYSSNDSNDDDWIIDSGPTDHMTFDASDFSKRTPLRQTCITNANGVAHPVTRARVVSISPSLSLSHTLLVPSLSNKLMLDILSKEIIGRGVVHPYLFAFSSYASSSSFQLCCFCPSSKNQRTKLDPYAIRCVFLGYGLHKKGYRCFDPIINRTYTSMDVTFLESESFFQNRISNSALQGESTVEESSWLQGDETSWFLVGEVITGVEIDNGEIALENEKLRDVLDREESDSRDNDEQLTSGEHATPITLQSDNEVNVTPPLTPVPEGSPPTENIHEVSSPITHPHTNNLDTSIYVLPFRQNRGKPPKRYSPDEQERKTRYPIANYVSTQELPKLIKTFMQALSSPYSK
ncbi:hypothetical protein GH714_000587 [Hevea brasiliensis]|uniref:Retroviral polymerase SH3-like domain-containing protein n=1 Tax=Hevea brasiliensis TaxID=3981 RepID=A0A6A6LVC6_HEVBR|nr:hypothetical protein GH714_000587 [Hevea brasiliensis]